MTSKKSYRIVRLTAENIKRLVAVDIQPDGNMVEITGRNGAGKTSVLDAIWWALAGTKNVQGKPIRDGEEQAIIELSLGSLVVTRTFRAKDDGGYTTKLMVQNEDGAKYNSPQAILDAIVGDLTFDPLHFVRQKPADQLNILQEFVTDFDFQDAAQRRRAIYDDRTETNRQIKSIESRIKAIPETPDDEIIDMDSAMANYQNALDEKSRIAERNASIDKAKRDIEGYHRYIRNERDTIDDLEKRIHRSRKSIEETEAKISSLKRVSERAPEVIPDIEAMKSLVDKARGQTAISAQIAEKSLLSDQLASLQILSENHSAEIKAIDAEKDAAVLNSTMPVDGISFDEEQVLLSGIPFSQASDAQQLRAAIEIGIAMNPQLRICRVRDGSLIDADGMKALAEYADKHDFQIWIERVDQSGKSGIVIENGQISREA